VDDALEVGSEENDDALEVADNKKESVSPNDRWGGCCGAVGGENDEGGDAGIMESLLDGAEIGPEVLLVGSALTTSLLLAAAAS
jgi:hypothetical protein